MEPFPNFKEIIKMISKENLYDSLILFGSALDSKNPNDFDIMLFKKDLLYNSKEIIKVIELLDKIEKSFKQVSCAFSSSKARKKNGEYLLSITPLDKSDIKGMPIFFYGLKKGAHFKVLEGENNPFGNIDKPSKEEFRDYLKRYYIPFIDERGCYDCLKASLRMALLYQDIESSKKDLIKNFEKNYNFKILKSLKELLKGPEYESQEAKRDLKELLSFLIKKVFNSKLSKNKPSKKYHKMVELYRKIKISWEGDKPLGKIKSLILSYQKTQGDK